MIYPLNKKKEDTTMNIHEDFIKKANKEIDKLTADIEKKKARIAELKSDIKKHEAERTRDSEFSDKVMKLLSNNGVNSDEDRKIVFSKFEEFMLELEMEKSENAQAEETAVSPQNADPAITAQAGINENVRSGTPTAYQNPAYPYKPTDN